MTQKLVLVALVLSVFGCNAAADDEGTSDPANESEVVAKPSATTPKKFYYVLKRDGVLKVHELNTETMECADGGLAYECPLADSKSTSDIDREVATSYGRTVNAKTALEDGLAIAEGTLVKKNVSGSPPAYGLIADAVWIAQDTLGTDAPLSWTTLEKTASTIKAVAVNGGTEKSVASIGWGYDYPAPLKERLERALASSEVLVYGGVRTGATEFRVLSVYLKVDDAKL